MKKFYTIISCVLILAACNSNLDVDMEYQLTANIDLTTVVKGMRAGNNEDYYTKEDSEPVLLTYMIYDEKGTLVHETEKKLDSFFEKSSFTTGLKTGKYTIVAWACTASDDVEQDWTTENKESLNTFHLNSYYKAYLHPVLGVSKIELDFNKSETLDIEMPTVGCFFTISFNYSTTTKATSAVCQGNSDSRYYSVNDGLSNIFTSTKDAWSYEYTVDTQYAGIYNCYFILPTNLEIIWGSFDANDNLLRRGEFTINAEAGKHQLIKVDIDNGKHTITPTTQSAALIEKNNTRQQVLDIGKMKAEPAEVYSVKKLF